MTARRRKWILAATLLGLAAAVWCFGRGGGRMEVKLIFLGYTNYDEGMPDVSPEEVFTRRIPHFQAFVLATNSGSVTVELCSRFYQLTYATNDAGIEMLGDFVYLAPVDRPRLLRPGESVVMTTRPWDFYESWFTEIWSKRCEFRDRLYRKASECGNATIQRFTARFLTLSAEECVTMPSVTNLPPYKLLVERAAAPNTHTLHPPRVTKP